ncbi:MAG: RNA polymerase sigma factor [Oscillospiraceae bacterium]|nr:RNA polymerase sigma factor [Oscillospiraceae bacterium]
MNDNIIVDMYWKRDEAAIKETEKKYGSYLKKVAVNILGSLEDSEESVNDTYLKAWDSIPPHNPAVLATFLGRITRQVSIDILRKRSSQKRKGSQFSLSLSELEDCVPSGGASPELEAESKLMGALINKWLGTLKKETRDAFVGRYYFMDSLKEVAAYCGMSESKAKTVLHRARNNLKEYLATEGF